MTTWREIPGNPKIFDDLVELMKTGEAVGFVGAGASAGLYPLWPQLIEQLADAAIQAGKADTDTKQIWCERMDPLQAARIIRGRLGEGTFTEFVRNIFRPKKGADGRYFTSVHARLAQLAFRAFVTTNYDSALTISCRAHRPNLLVQDFHWREDRTALWLQGQIGTDDELPILHAHGKFDVRESLVLDAKDYRRAYTEDRYRRLFEQLWTRQRLVVAGFSLSDPWLRIIADEALARADARSVSAPRHIALLGLPEADVMNVEIYREEVEEPYHLRALFYPVTRVRDADGQEHDDHSPLGHLLEELISASSPQFATPTRPPESPTPPHPVDPLDLWFQMVAAECRRMNDGFERPAALRQLERAWVQVKVQRKDQDSTALQAEDADPRLHEPTTLDEILKLPIGEPAWNQGHWLLEGPPGSGKTTLLRHLARRLAKERSTHRVPIFISLARLVDADKDWLLHITEGLELYGAGGLREALTKAGREGRLVLLLDGFDEIPREKRAGIRRWITLLRRNAAYSSCRLVVSSRPIGRDDFLEALPHLDLLALDKDRRREFLEAWLHHGGQPNWQTAAAAALDHLESSRRLWDLSGIPLYLTLLTILWQKGEKPSKGLADLYNEIFNLLLSGRHKPGARPMPSQSNVREALGILAAGMTVDDHWAEPLEDLEERLRTEELEDLRQRLGGVPAWRDLFVFLRDVHERTQILGPHDGHQEHWRFWHRTFREALTAERLHRQHEQDGTQALVEWAGKLQEGGEGRWAEPLALLASRLDQADDLIDRLAKVNPRLTLRAAALAQGLKPETIYKTLQLTENLKEREKVFESIPDQLSNADACLALVEQLKTDNRSGFDLFWLWWIVEEVERRWRPSARTRDLLEHFFDHIPRPTNSELLWTLDTPLDGPVSLWQRIPVREGQVGSPKDEEGRDEDEGPVHRVEITQPYWLGAAPVTNSQYALFDPGKPFYSWPGVSEEELATHPRVNITWYEAVSFCRWLATQPGFESSEPRLPMEEEWEYACRAKSTTRFWPGDEEEHLKEVGWYKANSDSRTHRVGRKPANQWQLYDLHGNAWEWTTTPWDRERYQDRPQDNAYRIDPTAPPADLAGPPRALRVLRGGSYRFTAQRCRSAYRNVGDPWFGFGGQGFRVLLSSAPSRP